MTTNEKLISSLQLKYLIIYWFIQ